MFEFLVCGRLRSIKIITSPIAMTATIIAMTAGTKYASLLNKIFASLDELENTLEKKQ